VKANRRLGRKIAKGATWLVALRVGSQAVEAASLIVLARLITPGDFGVVALGASIAAGIGLLQATGFGAALVQNQQATREDYDSAWSIQVCLSLICAVLLYAAAGSAARLFGQPALETVLGYVALVICLEGFKNVAVIDFQKNMDFRKEVVMRFSSLLVGKLAVIASAFVLLDYRALVVGLVTGSVVGLILSYAMKPHRPRITFSRAKTLFAFSAWVQLTHVVSFLNTHSKNFVAGSLGAGDLGLLNVSQNIATLSGQTIQGPINQASYPAFAKSADDLVALKDHYVSVLAYVTLLAMPTSIGIALIAPHVVPIALGHKWVDAAPLIQLLALASFAQALTAASNPVYMALNKPNLVAIFSAGRLCLLIPSLILGAKLFGVMGVAGSVALISTVLLPFRHNATRRLLKTTNRALIKPLVRPVLGTILMSGAVLGLDAILPPGVGLVAQIVETAILIIVGAVTFLASIALMWIAAGRPKGPEQEFLGVVRQRIGRVASETG
jgi:lipopolysaccharide exporter